MLSIKEIGGGYVYKEQKHTWRKVQKQSLSYTHRILHQNLGAEGTGTSLGYILLQHSLSLSGAGCLVSYLCYLLSPLNVGSFHINFTKPERNQMRNRKKREEIN